MKTALVLCATYLLLAGCAGKPSYDSGSPSAKLVDELASIADACRNTARCDVSNLIQTSGVGSNINTCIYAYISPTSNNLLNEGFRAIRASFKDQSAIIYGYAENHSPSLRRKAALLVAEAEYALRQYNVPTLDMRIMPYDTLSTCPRAKNITISNQGEVLLSSGTLIAPTEGRRSLDQQSMTKIFLFKETSR